MSTPTRYAIHSIADFLAVPAERRAACLGDFRIYLEMVEQIRAATAQMLDVPIALADKFTWIDDGVEGLSEVTVTVDGVDVLTMRHDGEPASSGDAVPATPPSSQEHRTDG